MAKIEKPVIKKQDGRKFNGGARPDAGRPAFVPTDSERKQVEAMSGYGLPIEQIAVLVRNGIHVDTLRSHFATELVSGKAKANSGVGRTLFQKAMGGDTSAMIWWSKTQMCWAETQKHEIVHTGISITDALEAAKARLIAGDVIDARIVEPRQLEEGTKNKGA